MKPKAMVHSTTAVSAKEQSVSDSVLAEPSSRQAMGQWATEHAYIPPASVAVKSKTANAMASRMRIPAMMPLAR